MLWFIHYKTDKKDYYGVMSEKEASCTSGGFESWLNHNGYKLTSKKFKNEEQVVKYCERLVKQNNLPDVVRSRLKAYIDKYYTHCGFILDSLDDQHNPSRS